MYIVEVEGLRKFLNSIRKKHKLIAPIKEDNEKIARFKEIKDNKDLNKLHLSNNTYFSLKEHWFKKRELLFTFENGEVLVPIIKNPKTVFFGIRRCDLHSIKAQDIAFNKDGIKDPYYNKRRENNILIGYHCNSAPDKYCFCGSLELIENHDLMIFDFKKYYIIETRTEKGIELVKNNPGLLKLTKKIIMNHKTVKDTDKLKNTDIKKFYNNKIWKEYADLCLSCGACNTMCPSCYCFNIYDEMDIDNLKKVDRKRVWSGCQLRHFTKVAGNHIFRDKRLNRFKHRIYHQLDYFKDRHGFNMCSGCGRCISHCPKRIDWIEAINKMSKKKLT